MEVLESLIKYQPKHAAQQIKDLNWEIEPLYRVDRGLENLFASTRIPFNIFDYLHSASKKNLGQRLRVLEGGCGFGQSLVDFKTGITFTHSEWLDLDVPEPLKRWRLGLPGSNFPGLGQQIFTTGITLTSEHKRFAQSIPKPYQIDKLLVGPIQYWRDKLDKQDFILDYFGAAYHFPEEAIPVYGQILKPHRFAYIRMCASNEELLGYLEDLIHKAGLEILDQSRCPFVDMLIYKPRT